MKTLGWLLAIVVMLVIIGVLGQSRIASTDSPTTTVVPTDAFKRFEAAFWELNRRVESQSDVTFFTDVEDLGDGIIQVTATNTWLGGRQEDQESNVQTLLNMWEAAEDSELPIAVRVVDEDGNVVMMRNR